MRNFKLSTLVLITLTAMNHVHAQPAPDEVRDIETRQRIFNRLVTLVNQQNNLFVYQNDLPLSVNGKPRPCRLEVSRSSEFLALEIQGPFTILDRNYSSLALGYDRPEAGELVKMLTHKPSSQNQPALEIVYRKTAELREGSVHVLTRAFTTPDQMSVVRLERELQKVRRVVSGPLTDPRETLIPETIDTISCHQ